MYVARVPNRNSPPAFLLREAYREDGKVMISHSFGKRRAAQASSNRDDVVFASMH